MRISAKEKNFSTSFTRSPRVIVTVTDGQLNKWKQAASAIDVPLAALVRVAMGEYLHNHLGIKDVEED